MNKRRREAFTATPQLGRIGRAPIAARATWIEDEQAFNFAVYAERAESVMLFLYSPDDLANLVLTFQLDPLITSQNGSGIAKSRSIYFTVAGQLRTTE